MHLFTVHKRSSFGGLLSAGTAIWTGGGNEKCADLLTTKECLLSSWPKTFMDMVIFEVCVCKLLRKRCLPIWVCRLALWIERTLDHLFCLFLCLQRQNQIMHGNVHAWCILGQNFSSFLWVLVWTLKFSSEFWRTWILTSVCGCTSVLLLFWCLHHSLFYASHSVQISQYVPAPRKNPRVLLGQTFLNRRNVVPWKQKTALWLDHTKVLWTHVPLPCL